MKHVAQKGSYIGRIGKVLRGHEQLAAALQETAKGTLGALVHPVTQPDHQILVAQVLAEQGLVEGAALRSQVHHRSLQAQLAEHGLQVLFFQIGIVIADQQQNRQLRKDAQDPQTAAAEQNRPVRGAQPQGEVVLTQIRGLEGHLENLGAVPGSHPLHGEFAQRSQVGHGTHDQVHPLHRAPDPGLHRGRAIGAHTQGLVQNLVPRNVQYGLLHKLLLQEEHTGFDQRPHHGFLQVRSGPH